MRLKTTCRFWQEFLKKYPDHPEVKAETRWQSGDRLARIEISTFTSEELDYIVELVDKMEHEPGAWGVVKKINSFRKMQRNPEGLKVAKLERLVEALKLYLKPVPRHWLFKAHGDFYMPFYISDIEYHKRDRHTPAHVTLTLHWMERGDRKTRTYTWHREDLKGGVSVSELLDIENLFVATEQLIKDYEEEMKRYKELQPATGAQFTAEGEGSFRSDERDPERHRWGGSQNTSMVQEGMPDKLIMDDLDAEGGEFGDDEVTVSRGIWSEEAIALRQNDDEEDSEAMTSMETLPVHPVVKMFNLTRHGFVTLHTGQLTPYEWNPKLGEKLILPEGHKDVIQVLMDTSAQMMDDIVKGKSGGTIVICTGVPGTGKTLTAEVTSEVISKPLYKVNCSQLGTEEEEIEATLSKVLARAARWQALLLIDEADVYVRERKDDIQQNAIVGVFLQVLEYYRGILFLTSNRATVIDDAILSRATAHLRYDRPSPDALYDIWVSLSETYGVKLDKPFIDKLVKAFPEAVGRDVKNLLKLVVRFSRQKKEKPTVEMFKSLAVHKDIKIAA